MHSPLWRGREEKVFDLNLVCVEAANGRRCLGIVLEVSPQGWGGFVQALYEEPAIGSVASLKWAIWWMDLRDKQG